MESFFCLVKLIEQEVEKYSVDEENYICEEGDEDDDDYFKEEREKSFELLVQEIEEEQRPYQPYIKAISSLLETDKKFDPNERESETGDTILLKIIGTGQLKLIKALVKAGANVNNKDYDGNFPLFCAARGGRKDIFDYLAPLTNSELRQLAEKELAHGLVYRQRRDNYAVEAFVHAALFGNLKAVSKALSLQIDINAISSNGETALHKAIRNKQLSIVEVLLEAGANPNIKDEDERGNTPLIIALLQGDHEDKIFQALLRAGADVNDSNNLGETALMIAVYCWNISAIKQLLRAGVNINAKNERGDTALFYAICQRGKFPPKYTELDEMIKILTEAGGKEN